MDSPESPEAEGKKGGLWQVKSFTAIPTSMGHFLVIGIKIRLSSTVPHRFWTAHEVSKYPMGGLWHALASSGILYSGELRGLDPQALAAHRAAARRFSAPIADQTAEVGRMFQGTECRNNDFVPGIRDLMSKCLPAYDLIWDGIFVMSNSNAN